MERAGSQCVPSGGGTGLLDKLKAGWKKITDSVKTVADTVSDKYHDLKGDKKCGEAWHNPSKNCCVNGKLLGKCGETCYDSAMKCCQDGIVYPKCESKCYDRGKECCKDGKLGKTCGENCYIPVVECCQDGKVYPGKTLYLGKCMTLCEAILERIGRINTYIAKWEADPNYTIGGDPNTATVIKYADAFCRTFKGPEIKFYDAFYNLAPELQKAITTHENVHAQQCKPYTFLGMTYYAKDKELIEKGGNGPFEIPAHEAEKRTLETSANQLHCQ